MIKKIAVCPDCHTETIVHGEIGEKIKISCQKCNAKGIMTIEVSDQEKSLRMRELDHYPVFEPYAYVKILKDPESLNKYYTIEEPGLNDDELKILNFIKEQILRTLHVRLDQLETQAIEDFLEKIIIQIAETNELKIDEFAREKILYYIKRDFVGYGEIDPIMRDPQIEDISCDGSNIPIFLYHRKYGSLQSNIKFDDEKQLSNFVVLLAQKCDKYISIAEPILDATLPDGSRIQMTLGTEVTSRGSTFTIRKFKVDPITATDLIDYKTMSTEMIAYLWIAVEHGINALIAGGTAAGKTSTLNAISLFIPHESKIVSIEETREINLPHPNWIPGVARSGFGEVIDGKLVGEIDLFDLMKAALRQRPEYILVGEIRGREAYVLFQAMATGHTTYSTFHADSTKSLIHRLEGKPIDIPRMMLQSLDIITIQISTRVDGSSVRRCKQIIEFVDIDPGTNEILTNEVFQWDPVDDRFMYSGKSYVLERIRTKFGLTKSEMQEELLRRVEVLEWMRIHQIRSFRDVANIVISYTENRDDLMKKIRSDKGYRLPHLSSQSTMDIPQSLGGEIQKISGFIVRKKENMKKILRLKHDVAKISKVKL